MLDSLPQDQLAQYLPGARMRSSIFNDILGRYAQNHRCDGNEPLHRHFLRLQRTEQPTAIFLQATGGDTSAWNYSSYILGNLYEQGVTNLAFFYELLEDQRTHDTTIILCGGTHARFIVDKLQSACSYNVNYDRLEERGNISGSELCQWITGFCGFCNECGRATKKGGTSPVASCACCKMVKFCSRDCQLQAWGSQQRAGHHKRCCGKIKAARVARQ